MAWKTITGVIQKNTTDDKIRLIIEGEATPIMSNIDTLASQGFSIFDDNFEDGNAGSDLTLSTGWTVGSDGIAISTNGGFGNSALFNKYTTIDRVSTRALVEIINTSSIFSIIRKPNFGLNQFGTVAEVNCSTNQLRFYGSWDGGTTPPSVVKSITIPFTIVANRKYLVELLKIKEKHILRLTDTTTLSNNIELVYNNQVDASAGAGRQWAAPGVMFISGSIKLKRFTYASLFRYQPKVLITGHSFVEGYALINQGDVSKSYSNLLYDDLAGNVAIAGRGGEGITTINTREDINYFLPSYHLVDIGANDTVYATWLTGIQDYITKILAKNSIPILCTIVPRADRQAFINQANTWIRSSGYNYVDFAKAVTLNNDGITQNPALFSADNVHPNIAGNAKMFEQIKIDAPYLWDGKTIGASSNLTKSTALEINTGTDDAKYTTPSGLAGSNYLTRNFTKITGTTGGTSTAYTATFAIPYTSYVAGQIYSIQVNIASGASPTLNIDGLGAKSLLRMDGTAIQVNDLLTGVRYLFGYDGTNIRLLMPINNEFIKNQSAALQTVAALWIATGRFETGIGAGIAPNVAAWLTLAASTSSKANEISTWGIAYTGNNAGAEWKEATDFRKRIIRDGVIDEYAFLGKNKALSGTGSAMLMVGPDGSLIRGAAIDEGFILDADVISAIAGATYTGNRANISPAGGKIFYQGDLYDDGTFTYIAIADNLVRRW